ncbi:MAG: terpene cyclase/mutase family protein [Clostridia bacterium]|nr:terpene cyclase/mutase family protein [Clostridia bacterium]
MKTKKLAVFAAIIIIIVAFLAVRFFMEGNANVLESATRYITDKTVGLVPGSAADDWKAMILARTGEGEDMLREYSADLHEYIAGKAGVLHKTRYTEYSRLVIVSYYLGEDPYNINGYDIVSPLHDAEIASKQGVNGAAWALMALDLVGSDDAYSREYYIAYMLDAQNEDGSIGSLAGSEVDMTAMALRSLAPYCDRREVAEACERGVAFLAARQSESGGFETAYGESSESIAQVILALDALGLDINDERFDADTSLYDALLSYRNRDGGFAHTKDGKSDLIATEQAIFALLQIDSDSEVTG